MKEDVDPILMMDPPPDSLSNSIADFEHKNVPVKLTLIASSQSFKSMSSNLTDGPGIPALFMSASIFPIVTSLFQ